MKVRIFLLLASLVLGLSIFSCEKDPLVEPDSFETEALVRTLSPAEQDFFDPHFALTNHPYLNGEVQSRDGYDPLIDTVLQQVLLLNQEHRFAEAMVDDYGYPVWSRGMVTRDPFADLIVIPFARLQEDSTSAFLFTFFQQSSSEFYFIWVERNELMGLLPEVPSDYLEYTRLFLFYLVEFDYNLFGFQSEPLIEWIDLNQEDFSGDEGGVTVTPRGDCEITVRFCVQAFSPGPEGEVEERSCSSITTTVLCTIGEILINNIISGGGGSNSGNNGGGNDGSSLGDFPPFPSGSTGWWPGGNDGNGSGGSTSSPESLLLQEVYSFCIALNEPDVIPGGSAPHPAVNEGNCQTLIHAMDNMVLSSGEWLTVLQNQALLDVAALLTLNGPPSALMQQAFHLYLHDPRNSTYSWQEYGRKAALVLNLQARLHFDADTFNWLLNEALFQPDQTQTVAHALGSFLGSDPDPETIDLANQVLGLAVELGLNGIETALLFNDTNLLASVSNFLQSQFEGINTSIVIKRVLGITDEAMSSTLKTEMIQAFFVYFDTQNEQLAIEQLYHFFDEKILMFLL